MELIAFFRSGAGYFALPAVLVALVGARLMLRLRAEARDNPPEPRTAVLVTDSGHHVSLTEFAPKPPRPPAANRLALLLGILVIAMAAMWLLPH